MAEKEDTPMTEAEKEDTLVTETRVVALCLSSDKHNGSDFDAIVRYIENKYGTLENLRELLSSELNELILQSKIEQVAHVYRIKVNVGTQTPATKRKDVMQRKLQDAAEEAARLIAEAETKEEEAENAFTYAEMLSQVADDASVTVRVLEELLAEYPQDD